MNDTIQTVTLRNPPNLHRTISDFGQAAATRILGIGEEQLGAESLAAIPGRRRQNKKGCDGCRALASITPFAEKKSQTT